MSHVRLRHFLISVLLFTGLHVPHTGKAELRWTWENPLPQGDNLLAIWGSSSNDIHAVGQNGSILHFDGQTWTPMPNNSFDQLNAVWGSSNDNVYAVGRSGNGSSGSVMHHFDGIQWSELPQVSDQELTAIWGTNANDVYIGGWNGRFYHFDGLQWTSIYTGSWSYRIEGIWASTPTDIFTVGTQGTIRHYNGSYWHAMQVPASVYSYTLLDIWGRSGNDVYVMGSKYENSSYYGIVLHYNGTQWQELLQYTGYKFNTLSATDSGNLIITADQGRVLFFDGNVWQERTIDLPGLTTLNAGWAATNSDAYFVGALGELIHWNGTAFTRIREGATPYLYGLWCGPEQHNIAVGTQGIAMHYLDGGWQAIDTGITTTFRDVWGADAQHVFAVGYNGQIGFFDGTSWSAMNSGTTQYLKRIWGFSASDVFAAGDGGILHYDGNNWSNMELPPYSTPNFVSIWGSAPDNVYAVSSGGDLLHYDGAQWLDTSFSFPSSTGYYTFPLDIRGTSADDIQVILTNGPVYHFDGLQWTEIASNVVGTTRIEAITPDNYWYAGNGGRVFHYDGSNWNLKPIHASTNLTGICMQTDGSMLVAGQNGAILRYSDVNETPSLNIYSPLADSTLDETSVVMLNAEAMDPEDGDLDASIQWSSDITGILGNGGTLYTLLPPGVHTLTASVTDSAGNTATRTLQLTILENTAPGITGFWSNTPEIGQSVSVFIFGNNFTSDGSLEVRFNGILQPLVSVVSSEMLIVRIMVDTSLFGPISVTTSQGTVTSSENFGDLQTGLHITGIWPGQVQAGIPSSIFLFGSGFSLDGSTEVYFNGVRQYMVATVSSDMMIVRVNPDENLSGPVTVTIPAIGSVISRDYFMVLP